MYVIQLLFCRIVRKLKSMKAEVIKIGKQYVVDISQGNQHFLVRSSKKECEKMADKFRAALARHNVEVMEELLDGYERKKSI